MRRPVSAGTRRPGSRRSCAPASSRSGRPLTTAPAARPPKWPPRAAPRPSTASGARILEVQRDGEVRAELHQRQDVAGTPWPISARVNALVRPELDDRTGVVRDFEVDGRRAPGPTARWPCDPRISSHWKKPNAPAMHRCCVGGKTIRWARRGSARLKRGGVDALAHEHVEAGKQGRGTPGALRRPARSAGRSGLSAPLRTLERRRPIPNCWATRSMRRSFSPGEADGSVHPACDFPRLKRRRTPWRR